MTKKDFILIARVLSESKENRNRLVETPQVFDRVAQRMADALADTNPLFDRGRFLTACGV